jgi:drug/metabolite transporter (DMT)-like permease
MTRKAWLLFAAMCMIWGIPYLLIRVAVRDIAPGTLVFLRVSIGGIILLPWAFSRGGFGPVLRRWRPLVLFSLIEMAGPWLFLSDAERHLSSSLSGLLIAAVPLVGVIVARAIRSDEQADWLQVAGLLVGLVGVAMLVGLDFGSIHTASLAEILVVVVGYAVAPVIMARRLADLPSIPVVSASLLLVAIGYLPYAVLRWPSGITGQQVAAVATLGVVCTAVAFILFFALIAAIGPARAVVITYVNPAVAVLFGVTTLGEDFTLGMGIGFPLILLGSVLAARSRARPDAAVPEAAACESLGPDQSMRTSPDAVSNTAATTPVPSSPGSRHSTSTPSNG